MVTASLNPENGVLRIVSNAAGDAIHVRQDGIKLLVVNTGQTFIKSGIPKVRIVCGGGEDEVYWQIEGADWLFREGPESVSPNMKSWSEIKVEDDDGIVVFECGVRVNGATKPSNPYLTIVQDGRTVQPTTLTVIAGNKDGPQPED